MAKRGTNASEVERAIQEGKKAAAKRGRTQYEYTEVFDNLWGGKRYSIKKIVTIVAEEEDFLEVVTVFAFYF